MRPLFLCLLTAFAACSKHNSGPRYTSDSVIGRWKLIGSSGGILGRVFTVPKDSLYILQLNSDSSWQYTINGRPTGSGTFSDTTVMFDNMPSPALLLKPSDLPRRFRVNQDTLILSDLFMDGFTSAYLRSPDRN